MSILKQTRKHRNNFKILNELIFVFFKNEKYILIFLNKILGLTVQITRKYNSICIRKYMKHYLLDNIS